MATARGSSADRVGSRSTSSSASRASRSATASSSSGKSRSRSSRREGRRGSDNLRKYVLTRNLQRRQNTSRSRLEMVRRQKTTTASAPARLSEPSFFDRDPVFQLTGRQTIRIKRVVSIELEKVSIYTTLYIYHEGLSSKDYEKALESQVPVENNRSYRSENRCPTETISQTVYYGKKMIRVVRDVVLKRLDEAWTAKDRRGVRGGFRTATDMPQYSAVRAESRSRNTPQEGYNNTTVLIVDFDEMAQKGKTRPKLCPGQFKSRGELPNLEDCVRMESTVRGDAVTLELIEEVHLLPQLAEYRSAEGAVVEEVREYLYDPDEALDERRVTFVERSTKSSFDDNSTWMRTPERTPRRGPDSPRPASSSAGGGQHVTPQWDWNHDASGQVSSATPSQDHGSLYVTNSTQRTTPHETTRPNPWASVSETPAYMTPQLVLNQEERTRPSPASSIYATPQELDNAMYETPPMGGGEKKQLVYASPMENKLQQSVHPIAIPGPQDLQQRPRNGVPRLQLTPSKSPVREQSQAVLTSISPKCQKVSHEVNLDKSQSRTPRMTMEVTKRETNKVHKHAMCLAVDIGGEAVEFTGNISYEGPPTMEFTPKRVMVDGKLLWQQSNEWNPTSVTNSQLNMTLNSTGNTNK